MGLGGLAALGSGAVTGAATGASFGPWGAAIGGAAGGLIGGLSHLFSSRAEEEEKKKRIEEQRRNMQAAIERQYANDISGITGGPRIPMYELDAQQGMNAMRDANAEPPFNPASLMPIVTGGAQLAGKLYSQANAPSFGANVDPDGFKYDEDVLKKASEEDDRKARLQRYAAGNPWKPYA